MAEIISKARKLEGDKVELEVEVPADEVRAQVDHTLKHMASDVRIPGFRKGKIPKAVLVSRFGKEMIFSQTLKDALPGWYDRALTQAGVKPIDSPELDFDELGGQDEPYSFKATVPVAPRPQLGKYTGIEVEKEVVEVKDEEVEEPIDRLRKRAGKIEKVEGRPAASGDFVVIDFEGFVDDEPLEGGSSKDYMLELGTGAFIPGFEDQIAGMKEGQSKKLKLTFPEDYQPQELAGKDAVFDVTVKEIKQRVLPELTDELVADNSEFETVEELRKDIRSRMEQAREAGAENLFREAALKKAVETVEVEIPPAMIESRIEDLKREFTAALQGSGVTLEQYSEQAGVTLEQIEDNFRQQAGNLVKEDLMLEAIAENESLAVGDDEVEEEIRKQAERRGIDADKLVEQTRKAGREEFVRENLLKRKALDFIVEKAVPVLRKQAVTEEGKPEIITP
ncbi:MAG: trigger factor [Thermoleophilia bacterium]